MKSKHLFQLFVLLALLFSPFGNDQPVRAIDQMDVVIVERLMGSWGVNHVGLVGSTRYENWRLVLTEARHFTVTATPVLGDLTPLLLLLDDTGNELLRGNGTLTSTQPAGNYSVQVQPQTGEGYYFFTIQEVIQNPPTVSIAVSSPSIHVSQTATVTVNLENVPAEGYTSAEFTCFYSSDLVEPSDIVIANRFGPDPAAAISSPYPDRFIVAIAGSQGHKAMTDGTVFTFEVTGLEPGQALLGCQARVSQGDNMLTSIDSTGGNIIILDDVLTPTVSPALCDKVQLVADVTIPDGTSFPPSATFTKTWRLKNVGSCTWTTSYQLVFFSGEPMGTVSSLLFPRNVTPGQTVDISVNLIAPSSPGSYRGYWMFKNSHGALFGIGAQANKPWWVDIRVVGATITPTIKPTSCDKAEFIADINVLPGTEVSPGAQFTKTWRLKNIGTCTWTPSYRLALLSGDQMSAPSSIQIPVNVAPGQTVDLSLNMTAPSATGSYRGYWIFQNSTGQPFGVGSQGNEPWFVDIVVANGTVTPTFTQSPSILRLTKSSSSQTYSGPDQTITYTFTITNTGTTALGPAQFTITDNKLGTPFNCGPADVTLAPGQSLSCSRDYKTTLSDMTLVNITNSATASGAGQTSAPATAVVTNLGTPATPSELPISTFTLTPGPSPTPTATSIPTMGTITGQVLAGKQVILDLFDADNWPVAVAFADADGTFSLTAPAGTYNLVARAAGFLSAMGPVTITAGGTTSRPTITLLPGDIDSNFMIDWLDAVTIGINYNTSFPPEADLNNDGIINVLDLELLARNYRKTGPVVWQ